jgi:hypothetical protein
MVLWATQGIQNVCLSNITEIRIAAVPKPLRPLFRSIRKRALLTSGEAERPIQGLFVMEREICRIYAQSDAAVLQLPITEFAHKTGVVSDLGVAALVVLAARDMTAERCRAAALDRRHHLELAEADMAGVGLTPRRSMAAEDIRNLQRRAGHRCGLLCRVFPVLSVVLAGLRPGLLPRLLPGLLAWL